MKLTTSAALMTQSTRTGASPPYGYAVLNMDKTIFLNTPTTGTVRCFFLNSAFKRTFSFTLDVFIASYDSHHFQLGFVFRENKSTCARGSAAS